MKETTTPVGFGTGAAAIDAVEAIYAKCVSLGMSGQLSISKDASIIAFIEGKITERNNWEETAKDYCNSGSWYREHLKQMGELFGKEAKTADDGVVHEDVLISKVPLLVAGAVTVRDTLLEQNRVLQERIRELEQARESNQKADANLSPEILAVLIDVAMNLVKGCLAKNKTPEQIASTNPLLAQIAIRQGLREAGVKPTPELVETGLKAFDGVTANEVAAVAELDFIM